MTNNKIKPKLNKTAVVKRSVDVVSKKVLKLLNAENVITREKNTFKPKHNN